MRSYNSGVHYAYQEWKTDRMVLVKSDRPGISAFRKLGGFNPEYFAAEELDLSQRLQTLAREQQKKIVILRRHPLVTSARKMKLYTPRELGGFFLRSIFSHRRAVRSRETAYMWYDGRR